MVSKAALTPVVNAAEVGVISDGVFELLGSTVEYHLKDVIQEAMKVLSCC
jgi:TATA box binding protein associated factor (TAF)